MTVQERHARERRPRAPARPPRARSPIRWHLDPLGRNVNKIKYTTHIYTCSPARLAPATGPSAAPRGGVRMARETSCSRDGAEDESCGSKHHTALFPPCFFAALCSRCRARMGALSRRATYNAAHPKVVVIPIATSTAGQPSRHARPKWTAAHG